MPAPLDLIVDDDGTTLVIRPVGEIDMYSAPDVEASLRSCTNGHREILFDVSEVEFLDSTALRMLIEAHRRDDRFALRGHSVAVDRLIELTGTGSLFRRSA
jgi:anti-sigma B factor antagonist